jgi:hypothetical protein
VGGVEMEEALKVPNLEVNVISEGVLQASGYDIVSKGDWRKLFYGRRLVIKAKLVKGLFV